MGRTQQSQGLAPPAIRKDQRAKQARQIVNKTIPAILASNPRARKGAEGSELVVDPGPVTSAIDNGVKEDKSGEEEAKYVKRKGQGRRKDKGARFNDAELSIRAGRERDRMVSGRGKKGEDSLDKAVSQLPFTSTNVSAPARNFRIINTDTLAAAHIIKSTTQSSRRGPNVCILNMASPLRPGGGVLAGATSQEETLCTHTTLLPSLNESFYRLPEYGGIFTRDVLVLRDGRGELAVADRYFIDAISAGMLRFPDLLGGEDEEKRLGKKDRLIVERKIRAVLRIASARCVKKIILGAWGCGAYGNPLRDVAEAFHKALHTTTEPYPSVTDIVFAISNRKMAQDFAKAFDPNVAVEPGPGKMNYAEDEDETDAVAEELKSKIQEMESQVSKVWNADLKARMGVILEGLRSQLQDRESGDDDEEGNDIEFDEGALEHDGDDDVNDGDTAGLEDEERESSEDGGCSISPPRRA